MGSIQLPPEEPTARPRLMVVDDEPSSVKAVRKHLADAGYEDVVTACESCKVMDLLAEVRPDLLLLDIMMPGVSGLDILQRIRHDERFRDLSVIILTASTELHVKARALALGVTDFLQKPIDPTELMPRIRNALSINALRRHCESLGANSGDDGEDAGVAKDEAAPAETAEDKGILSASPKFRLSTLDESCPSWLSWPVLRRTWFRDLKTTAKVMIVDDEPVVVKVVQKYLGSDGYKTFITTSDASRAFDMIETEQPDVVLLDIIMPQVSGLEILERVRATERLMDLPVIILTAATDRATKQRALDLGATEFLTKPVDPTEALPRVRNALVIKLHQDYIKDYARRVEREMSRHLEKVRDYTSVLERTNEVLRRSRSAAQAASRVKSQFLANMSHEIRTPLSAMIGYAEMMLGESATRPMPEQDIAALNTIVHDGKHLIDVINDTLDLSKIEAGHLEIETIACSPTQVVAEVLRSMENQAEHKKLALLAECATPIPETVRTNPTCLRRILINLVGNALKYTEEGSVRVVLSLLGDGDGEPVLQFDVIDTGVGLTEEQRVRLFQPFAQTDAPAQRKCGGIGLGLVIANQLAESLGGGILVESEPGRGSTFRVAVPVELADDTPTTTGSTTFRDDVVGSVASPGRDSAEKLDCRVLLAEDSVDNQRLISLLLRKAGADVTVVDNGLAAYEKAVEAFHAGTPFDVILMDIQMPVLDGYAATQRLREQGYTLPVIAVTAHAMSGEREKCLAAGCDDYATKPIQRDLLLATVARHVRRSMPTVTAAGRSETTAGARIGQRTT